MFVECFPSDDASRRSLEERPLEQLEHEICELAAHISAQTCHWLGLVAEFDRREGWASWGLASCADWLAFKCAISATTAREHVRVARAIQDLPLIRAGFAAGELSYSKVRALTRVATPESEEQLVEFVGEATAAQLELAMRAYRRVKRLEDVREAHASRYLRYHWDEDGSLVISGRLPAEQGALLLAGLQAAKDALRASAETPAADTPGTDAAPAAVDASAATPAARPRAATAPADNVREEAAEYPASASAADALVLMADSVLATGPAARTGGDRYQVVVHVDRDTLASRRETPLDDHDCGRCELRDGPGLHPETIRRLACDASLVAIAERDGEPLDVGRKTRSIPPALRRALTARDRGCRFPGCNHTRYLQAHHIEHWAHGGHTKLENLISLCSFHHRLLHEHGYTLHTTADGGCEFRRPNGQALPANPIAPALTGVGIEARNHANGHTITHTTNRHGPGEPMQLDYAVDALITWIDGGT